VLLPRHVWNGKAGACQLFLLTQLYNVVSGGTPRGGFTLPRFLQAIGERRRSERIWQANNALGFAATESRHRLLRAIHAAFEPADTSTEARSNGSSAMLGAAAAQVKGFVEAGAVPLSPGDAQTPPEQLVLPKSDTATCTD